MHFQKILLYVLVFHVQHYFSQTFNLSGKITSNGEPLAFATIYVKGTTIGCSSNSEGQYTLKLEKGYYEIEFHYLGYYTKTEKVNLSEHLQLNVNLINEGLLLKEVEINGSEDPAYAIIKNSIKKRNHFYNQIEEYNCKTYIKGFQKIEELPKNFEKVLKMFGGKVSDTSQLKGIIYLSESESEFYFKKPNQVQEIMFSSKVSGNNQAFSFNKLTDLNINFYKNLVQIGPLSDRPLISPIHENAFLFYKFNLLEINYNQKKAIYKIKVTPKRSQDPCFKGTIYIQDSTWRLTGVDLRLNKLNKINFVDTLYIKQIHAPIENDSIWMPVNLNLTFDFKVFGVKGYGYFNAHIKNYNFSATNNKKNNNELLSITNEASLKDSAYWKQNRPIPLTDEEQKDYKLKDSIKAIISTKRYQDSVDRVDNQFGWMNLIAGYNYNNSFKKFKISLAGLINNGLQYNTVEGINVSYQINAERTKLNLEKIEMHAKVRYGFSNYLWGGELGWRYNFKPIKFTRFEVKLKSIVEQYNHQNPITPLVNSVYTLLFNENYLKLFKETGIETNFFTELINGVYFTNTIKYLQRDPLINTTNLLLIDNTNKLFTSNEPRQELPFKSNRAFITNFVFSFRFHQKYYSMPNQKIIVGSKYPRLNISYTKAIPIFKSEVNFDLLTVTVSDELKLGLFGKLDYRISGGSFLRTTKLYFMDYKHFLGNQTIVNTNNYLNSFRLLPYYVYSTNKWYTEIHSEHHFKGFIINKIPLINKLTVQEIIGLHALYSNTIKNYYEVNFGLERVFKVIRLDYVLSYNTNMPVKHGFTLGLYLVI